MSTVADKLAKKSTSKPAKQVRLRLVYIDFWSAVKLSFLSAVAVAVATVVAVFLLYMLLQATGLIGRIDDLMSGFFADGSFKLANVLGLPQVMAVGAGIAILNLVVITVLGAVVAGIYNLMVKVTGGLLVGFTSN